MKRLLIPITLIIFLTSCAPVATATPTEVRPTSTAIPTQSMTPVPTSTPKPTATATVTIEPTATATVSPTEVPVVLPDDLAAQVNKLTVEQRAGLMAKVEDTRWKLDVYEAIKKGSPNLKLILGVWENPGVPNDVEVAYKLPAKPNTIYFPSAKLQKNHTLPPSEITQEMMEKHEVVDWYTQVITKELEKSSSVPAGSKLAKVNDEFVYLSKEGIEAKLNIATGEFEQQVVRNPDDQIPFEGGESVKLVDLFKVSKEGVFNYMGITGPNPKLKEYTLPKLPEGYEYTAFVFTGYNVPNKDMSNYLPKGKMFFGHTTKIKKKFICITGTVNHKIIQYALL